MNNHRRFISGCLTVIASAYIGVAQAQNNPSADQIINSLKPGAGMSTATRGIRPIGPTAETPANASNGDAGPSSAALPARSLPHNRTAASQDTTGAPSVNLSVQFATNSAELTPAAIKTLTELGQALASNELMSYKFRIEGYTDTVGSASLNQALSERRAQAVVAFLTSTFKVDPSRLEAIGMGERGLLVRTPPNTPEARNRRVQVINLGA